jgi:hypothetical protein
VALVTVLLWTGAVAHADGSLHHGTLQMETIRGLVTFASGSSMHVQTQSGAVSVGLTSSTGVTRIVVGSDADLAKGEQVIATFTAPGSNVIKFIHIELASQSHDGSSISGRAGQSKSRYVDRRLALAAWADRPSWKVTGQILSIDSSSITLRTSRGSTATYGLVGDLKVSKTMPGRVSDIDFGETVSAFVNRTSSVATEVCILSS